MQGVRRKNPIKYNKDGSVSLDGSGVKILRLLEPQGEPDVIECDGRRYVPEREIGISKFQKITGTSYVEAKHILDTLKQEGARVVE